MFSHGKVDWTASCFLVNKIVSPPPCTDAKRELEIWGHPLYRWNMQSSSIWRLPYNNCCSIDGAPLLGDSTKICCRTKMWVESVCPVTHYCECAVCTPTCLPPHLQNLQTHRLVSQSNKFNDENVFCLDWSPDCHFWTFCFGQKPL